MLVRYLVEESKKAGFRLAKQEENNSIDLQKVIDDTAVVNLNLQCGWSNQFDLIVTSSCFTLHVKTTDKFNQVGLPLEIDREEDYISHSGIKLIYRTFKCMYEGLKEKGKEKKEKMNEEAVKDLFRKLRLTEKEFGKEALENAFIVGSLEIDGISYLFYYTCPTITKETLGNVSFKVARFFEDA